MIRVLVADDNPVVREGLVALLEASGGIEVVAQAADGAEAVAAARRARPDVALLDVRMPVHDGVAAAVELASFTAVLMLSYLDEERVVTAALRAGAAGYLVHGSFEPAELYASVLTVARGGSFLSAPAAAVALQAVRASPDPRANADRWRLTSREAEIMGLVARGLRNGDIAATLFVTEKTVKNHLNRAYAKLGTSSRGEAMARWLGTADIDAASADRPRRGTADIDAASADRPRRDPRSGAHRIAPGLDPQRGPTGLGPAWTADRAAGPSSPTRPHPSVSGGGAVGATDHLPPNEQEASHADPYHRHRPDHGVAAPRRHAPAP